MMLDEAISGDVAAQYSLGLSYASGIGVDVDLAEAAKWYQKAAEQGMAAAQKNFALQLAKGQGVKRNRVEAYKWYEISIPNLPDSFGRDELRFARNALGKEMTAEQRAEASKLAMAWILKYTARTGRKLSPIEGYKKHSRADGTQGWHCDEKPTKGRTPDLWLNPCLLALPTGKWIQIHQQKRGDAVRFALQHHGGSSFDTRRGRIIMFGSDTHDALLFGDKELINSPLVFDVAKLQWRRFYPSDPLQTYNVTRSGLPVAGFARNHPWAMHTYGAVSYDHRRDQMVVSSHPQHMLPGQFVNSVAHLWRFVKRHPTWVFSFKTNRWTALSTTPQSFFIYSTAYDSNRASVIGHRREGVFELGGKHRKWRQLSKRRIGDRHSNSVFDAKHKAVVVFGGGYDTGSNNDIVAFWPATRKFRKMPTPGPRPRADAHVPMAYHRGMAQTVFVIDEDGLILTSRLRNRSSAETWLYDLGKDQWTHVKSARLPLGLGMNYNMEYDPEHNLVLLAARDEKNRTTIWALRL